MTKQTTELRGLLRRTSDSALSLAVWLHHRSIGFLEVRATTSPRLLLLDADEADC